MATDTTRPRPMRADAVRNRALVLDAASAAFHRHGVSASLDDVARAAGVGPGTMYRHFPTRDELVMAVIDEGLTKIRDLGVEMLAEPDPLATLHRWLIAYVDVASGFDGLARTLATPADSSDQPSSCQLAREAGAALVKRAVAVGQLRADVEAGDVVDMALAIAWVAEQPGRLPDQRNRLLQYLIDGLSPLPRGVSRRRPGRA